jgi:hypothetical protein
MRAGGILSLSIHATALTRMNRGLFTSKSWIHNVLLASWPDWTMSELAR